MSGAARFILFVVVALFLVVAYYFLRPAPQAGLPRHAKVFEISVKNGMVLSGPTVISVAEGDRVTLRVTANQDEELHLHGYDVSVQLKKNEPAELSLDATTPGRFTYELEHSKTEIGALEVLPK